MVDAADRTVSLDRGQRNERLTRAPGRISSREVGSALATGRLAHLTALGNVAILAVGHVGLGRLIAGQLDGGAHLGCDVAAVATLAQQRIDGLQVIPTCVLNIIVIVDTQKTPY